MANPRRVLTGGAILGSLLLALGLLRLGPAEGQVVKKTGKAPVMQPSAGGPASQFSALKLLENPDYRKLIEGASAAIRDAAKLEKEGKKELASRDWNDAVTALQSILDNKEDFYVQIKERLPNGTETARWTSVKFEANNLLGSMPAEGLDIYELRFGAKAQDKLDEAKKTGDRELFAEVATRFLHTRAGAEANDLLATSFLDRGQFFMAALRFERLLAMDPKRVPISDLTLYKAALAFKRAGDLTKAEDAWRRLEQKLQAQGGMKIGDSLIPIAKLQQVLAEIPRLDTHNPHDWPLIRGNQTNSAQANGSPPMLDVVLWQRSTLQDKDDESGEVESDNGVKGRIDAAVAQFTSANMAVLPGSFPIVAGKLMIYRSYADIRAVHLHDGKDAQGNAWKAGQIAWKSTQFDGSLVTVFGETKISNTMSNWLAQYANLPGFSGLVFENTTLGTLATDHRFVYAVDDLAVPAPPNVFQPYIWNNSGQIPQDVKPLVLQNGLHAYELHTGKFKWRLNDPRAKDDPFADSHFLGVPLSVGGKLYVLNEKNFGVNGDAELRLVCVDPNTGKIIPPMQTLGIVQQQHRVTHDMSRRLNAVHLAYGEGILVCPTNAGEVLGVDLLSRSLAWAYPYREQAPNTVNLQPIPNQPFVGPGNNFMRAVSSNWKSSPPVIAAGKVVFTAPDASSVHCIHLRDGTPSWSKRQQEGDLYLAGVYGGKVVIVGKNAVRGLDLASGDQVWYVPTNDLPSGQGVANKNIYYLPLSKGEICAIDLEKGTIKARNRAKAGSIAPGNLVFYEGMVLSQTPREILAYPQLVARLQLANVAVLDDPNNPEKLVNRGELLLADGQVQNAVNDLKSALTKNPDKALVPRAKMKLYEALTDLFQIDFDKASTQYLDEYHALCKAPDNPQEQQERLAKFYRVMGQGREAQGNLVEAFVMYREFGALPINQQGGVALDDPTYKVPAPVWLKGRISAMMAKAKPAQRLPLEEKIAAEWKLVQAKKDIDSIRSFVSMFDVPFAVGRDARLQLASTILERNERASFLEAELNLQQLCAGEFKKDPNIGGKALATLALLEEKKGTADAMKLAACYYRELGKTFADAKVRDDKTGADLFNELATDKRFLPYLEEAGSLWGTAKIGVRELGSVPVPAGLQGFMFQPQGELSPLMKSQRLILDQNSAQSNNPQVRLVDLATNSILWTVNLGPIVNSAALNFQSQFFQYLYQQGQANIHYYPNARFRFYQVKGHLAVFQVGTMVYALDLGQAKVLWQHALVDATPLQPNMVVQAVIPDNEGNLELIVWNQFNGQRTRTALGSVGSVQASHVALVTQKGLAVLDPLRGTTLWSKMDVSPSTQVFGDEEYLFLVDGSGAGRCLRANDGASVDVPNFGPIFQSRIHVLGRTILAGVQTKDGFAMKLYDVPGGKDLWSKTFDSKAVVLKSEQPQFTGVIEPDGKLVILDVATGAVLLENNVLQMRISGEDIKALHQPLLLADNDRFYIALNKPIDTNKVSGGVISNNFANGLRCGIVNGWFMAFGRRDMKIGERAYKKGDFHWHSLKPLENQMVVLEQFDSLPVVLFTSRYNELINGGAGGNRWIALTQSLHKHTGKMLWNPEPRPSNSTAQYYAFTIDVKAGTINLVGYNGTVQHYIDDGRKLPPNQGTGIKSGPVGLAPPYSSKPAMVLPGLVPNGQVPVIVPGRRLVIQVAPPVEKKAVEKK